MKKIFFLSLVIALIIGSCAQKTKDSGDTGKTENTYISVGIVKATVGIDPAAVLSHYQRRNKAIDSLGYKGFGYMVWQLESDSNKENMFMSLGFWPDKAVYDTIHNNELFLNSAKFTPEEEKLFAGDTMVFYNRFKLIK